MANTTKGSIVIRGELARAENVFPHTNDYLYDTLDYLNDLTRKLRSWLSLHDENRDYAAIFSVYRLLLEATCTVQRWTEVIDSYAEKMASIVKDAYKEIER